MEKNNSFPALVLMPSNRVSGFLQQIPNIFQRHFALISGIRCREEAFALEALAVEKLQQLLSAYPKDAAVRYYLPIKNDDGKAKVCTFTLQFEEEPQIYAVWCQCCKVVATLSNAQVKMLRFAIFEDLAQKQVCFQSFALYHDDRWVQLMLNFAHNIQPDEHEWVASEIKFESCDIICNF